MADGQEVLPDITTALQREWILTNGRGGFSAGTAAGIAARRSHALLTAAGEHGRLTTLLLRIDERAQVAGVPYELGGGFVAGGGARTGGFVHLHSFRAEPWPLWRLRIGDAALEKSVLLLDGHHAVAISYRHGSGPPIHLTLAPLMVARAPYGLMHETPEFRGAAGGVPGRVQIETLPDQPGVTLWHNGSFLPARVWQRGTAYPLDPGLTPASGEAAFTPGYIEATLAEGAELHLVVSTEESLFRALADEERLGTPPPRSLAGCVAVLEADALDRRSAWRTRVLQDADYTARQAAAAHGGASEPLARRLTPILGDRDDAWTLLLADALHAGLTRRGHRLTLMPSFPRAEERGSETLRAVPALIALRQFEAAREIVRGYVEYLDEGLAPESFDPIDGTPRYGDPEPTLWLIHAADLLARRTEDLAFTRDFLFPALEGAMQLFRAGTRGGVRVMPDGLLSAGEGEHAMRRADLNVLWYHAQVAMAQLSRIVGRKESGAFYLAWAHAHQRAFNEHLWDEACGCLTHARVGDFEVRGVSPSQLWALALTPSLLPPERAKRLLATIERELVAGGGLRVRPGEENVSVEWLGPWLSALLRTRGRGPATQARARARLDALAAALESAPSNRSPRLPATLGLDPGPFGEPAPRAGEFASPLAAAELLRVWIEEMDHAEHPPLTSTAPTPTASPTPSH